MHVSRLRRGRDLVVPLVTRKVAVVSVGCTAILFFIVDVDCAQWISFCTSFCPIDSNFNSSTIILQGRGFLLWSGRWNRNRMSPPVPLLDVLCSWPWFRWGVFLVLFAFTNASKITFLWTQAACFSRGGAAWSWPFVVYATDLVCVSFLVVVWWLVLAFILWFLGFLWVNIFSLVWNQYIYIYIYI